MLTELRKIYNRWKHRPTELFSKFDDGVECVLLGGIIWQAWRMTHFAYGTIPSSASHNVLTQVGTDLSINSYLFWNTAFNMPVISSLLIILSVISFIGLMDKNEPMRLIGTIFSSGWWIVSGTLLTIHSPLHDAGGLYYLLGLSGTLIYAHRFVMVDRNKEIPIINTIIYVYEKVYMKLHNGH